MSLFFKNHGPHNINKIIKNASYVEKTFLDKNTQVKNVSTLEKGNINEISFFEKSNYSNDLKKTKVSYCFIRKNDIPILNNKSTYPIISKNPLLDFILTAKLFYPDADKDSLEVKEKLTNKAFKLKNTFIDKSVKINQNFNIGYNSIIKRNVILGKNVSIGSNCNISNCIIGDDVIINDGSVIGKIGYGFKYINKDFHFIPHIGHVEIGNNVYIGSNCMIDRGSFSNTIIGEQTKIDNGVHIAHNVNIGSYCNIAAQVGIAGSTKIGNNCMIGGQVGISGHLVIGNNVYIGGKSGVLKNIKNNVKVMGYPATTLRNFLKFNNYD